MTAYLDHAATTPMLPEALTAMTEELARAGNASSLHTSGRRARRAIESRLDREQVAVRHDLARVRAVSPQATLERGYAILVGERGQPVNAVGQVEVDEDVVAHLADGQLVLRVRDVRARGGT